MICSGSGSEKDLPCTVQGVFERVPGDRVTGSPMQDQIRRNRGTVTVRDQTFRMGGDPVYLSLVIVDKLLTILTFLRFRPYIL